uniref:Zinc finger protein rotund n=1 Tax=Strongyloides papillosus TaxID=174720 RepID=A0A0N5C1A8_STREA
MSQTVDPFFCFQLPFDRPKQENQPTMREAKPYKCQQCTKSFANNSYLSQHLRIHSGVKPFGPCKFCGKSFTQLSHLQQHLRTHTGEKPYRCKIEGCGKAFSQLSNLQSHSRCHEQNKPFRCNSCYKCFSEESQLLEHIPKHQDSKHLKKHLCRFCGKSYAQAVYLEKHMAKHSDRRGNITGQVDHVHSWSQQFNNAGDFLRLGQSANAAFNRTQEQLAHATASQSNLGSANLGGPSIASSTYNTYQTTTPTLVAAAAANSAMMNQPTIPLDLFNGPAFNIITPLEKINQTYNNGGFRS